MKIPKFDGTKELIVDFQSVRYGLMDFKLILGDKSFETRFSDVFDPLSNFRKWLEAVSIGVEQCSFSFDTEGTEVKFDLERISWNRDILTVTEPYSDAKVFLTDYVVRKQIVKSFYFGLLDFRNSAKFEKYEWEADIFSERLTTLLQVDYETLVNRLSKFGRKQLNDWLCQADPRHWTSAPTEEEEIGIAVVLKSEFASAEKTFSRRLDRSEIRWNIPINYSNWNIQKKRKLVEECISENCSRQSGTKIADFKSEIIEDYLTSKR